MITAFIPEISICLSILVLAALIYGFVLVRNLTKDIKHLEKLVRNVTDNQATANINSNTFYLKINKKLKKLVAKKEADDYLDALPQSDTLSTNDSWDSLVSELDREILPPKPKKLKSKIAPKKVTPKII